MSAHAKFPPSAAERWLACPGSFNLSATVPPSPDSPYAAEGTKAHECLEKLLTGKSFRPTEYDHEMITHGRFAEAVIKTAAKKGNLFAETKSDLTFIDKDFWGTADATIVEEFGRLTVVDYKYGAGIPVDPENNPQLIAYALGKAFEYDFNFSEVALVIIQPRAEHERGPVREWLTTIPTLKKWWKKFKEGTAACRKKDAELVSGDHCRWCPAKIVCPEQSTRAFKQALIDFDEEGDRLSLPTAIKELIPTGEKLGKYLEAFERIENYIGAVREHAFHQLNHGHKVPGWKLVPKRATRKWTDAEAVEKIASKKFGDKAYKRELHSPAQLEKIAGKDFVLKYASNVSSGLKLVSERDDSQEGTSGLTRDFENV
jgi:hypothetical protein